MSPRSGLVLRLCAAAALGAATSIALAEAGAVRNRSTRASPVGGLGAAVLPSGEAVICDERRAGWLWREFEFHRGPAYQLDDSQATVQWGGWGGTISGARAGAIPRASHPPLGEANWRREYQAGWPRPCLWGALDVELHGDVGGGCGRVHIVRAWPREAGGFSDDTRPFSGWYIQGPRYYLLTGVMPFSLALDTGVHGAAWWLLLWAAGQLRRRLRENGGRCGRCKYDLGGTPPGRACPECGEPTIATAGQYIGVAPGIHRSVPSRPGPVPIVAQQATTRYDEVMPQRATMNISIPPSMKAWIDQQVDAGGYGTASEFIRHLVRQAQAQNRSLEDSLLSALAEGPTRPVDDAAWERIRVEGRRRTAALKRRAKQAPASRRKSA